jgi:hypothetical protein
VSRYTGFTWCAHFALDDFASFVLAFPAILNFFGFCRSVDSHPVTSIQMRLRETSLKLSKPAQIRQILKVF